MSLKDRLPFQVRRAMRAKVWDSAKLGRYALFFGLPFLLATSNVGAGEQTPTSPVSPQYSTWDSDRDRLLQMSDKELHILLERANKEQVRRIVDLAPERMLTVPARFILGAVLPGHITAEGARKIIEFAVSQLLYDSSRKGIEHFQTDIGAEPTGELTFGELMELSGRLNRQKDTPVYASGNAKISNFEGWVSVAGSWVLQGEDVENSINTAEITCDRSRNECLRVTAYLDVPDINKEGEASYQLRVTSDFYRIVSWEPTEVVARGNKCGTALLTLKMNSHEVYEVASGNGVCKPGVSRLVSGFKFTEDFWRKRLEVTCGYSNPRATRELIEAIGGKACPRPQGNNFVPEMKFAPDDNRPKVKSENP